MVDLGIIDRYSSYLEFEISPHTLELFYERPRFSFDCGCNSHGSLTKLSKTAGLRYQNKMWREDNSILDP